MVFETVTARQAFAGFFWSCKLDSFLVGLARQFVGLISLLQFGKLCRVLEIAAVFLAIVTACAILPWFCSLAIDCYAGWEFL